jgi:lipid-binding SYLF domain-containing protein
VRLVFVVESKNLPLSYAERARSAIVNRENLKRIFVLAVVLAAVASFTSITPQARSDDEHAGKVKEAAAQSVKAGKVFDEIMHTPDKAIPRDLLKRAKAIAVFPQVIKAAFWIGGEGGRGVVSRRTSAGWSDPVFFRAGGGSVGPQIGASATDFVLLFMNDDAVAGLMKDKFELGAEADVAGGPVGREAGAGTDALMHAQILSYSRSRGLFAGLNLKGVVIRPEDDLNRAVYSKSARQLLSDDGRSAADTAAGLPEFPQTITRYTTAAGSDPQPPSQ